MCAHRSQPSKMDLNFGIAILGVGGKLERNWRVTVACVQRRHSGARSPASVRTARWCPRQVAGSRMDTAQSWHASGARGTAGRVDMCVVARGSSRRSRAQRQPLHPTATARPCVPGLARLFEWRPYTNDKAKRSTMSSKQSSQAVHLFSDT